MGWWKADEGGGISCDMPSGHPGTEDTLVNAIPGRDDLSDFYVGDGPADVMIVAKEVIKYWFREEEEKPDIGGCVNLMLGDAHANPHIDALALIELRMRTWARVVEEYRRSWGRPPHREECMLLVRFSFGRCDDLYGWWACDERNQRYVDSYLSGNWSPKLDPIPDDQGDPSCCS